MWFRKRETDIEMEGMRGKKEEEVALQDKYATEKDTDYQPVNWKKLLLSPKYIRKLLRALNTLNPSADTWPSMAYSLHRNRNRDSTHHNTSRRCRSRKIAPAHLYVISGLTSCVEITSLVGEGP